MKIYANLEGLSALQEQKHGTLTYPKWHPVGYASRSLRDYENRYAQIIKETLSIVFGVKRFYECLYGRKLTVINDHRSLKSIFSIVSCPPRIQKFFLRLQKYEFDLKYSPAQTMLASDALSLGYIKNSKPEFDENNLIHHVHFAILNLPISNERLEQFKEENRKDPILKTLLKYTIEGWPENVF